MSGNVIFHKDVLPYYAQVEECKNDIDWRNLRNISKLGIDEKLGVMRHDEQKQPA